MGKNTENCGKNTEAAGNERGGYIKWEFYQGRNRVVLLWCIGTSLAKLHKYF